MTTVTRIEVEISRLVLDGVDVADRQAVATAVERRLSVLLAGAELPRGLATPGARSWLDAGSLDLPVAGTPGRSAALGEALAGNLVSALGPAPRGGGER
ncbi:MAG: hypothetical protein KDD11_04915 [Acidobacteria bacterium]|nr:hypothetical protein [Acidobacteriota bacterium]